MKQRVDLRSDTVTRPTPAMRRAMSRAEVGDDVFREDPTVNRLERIAAERLGMESALFVPSGTMGNLVALLTHCGRGEEIILGDQSHTFLFEQGGMAALGGIVPRTIPNQPDGTLRLEDIEGAVRSENIHFPRSRLVCLENTHNICNGMPLSPAYCEEVARLAHGRNMKVHLDGARIFHAAVALQTEASELAKHVDSVTFCLSKGLCAPVGSLLCGEESFISEARRRRKVLGGGMRQAGVLAAAGIVALEEMVERLAETHERAEELALGLSEMNGVEVSPVRTNILYFRLVGRFAKMGSGLAERLAEQGILVLGREDGRFRAVTHYWIGRKDIDYVLKTMNKILQ
jgi:threonine aldolase